MKNDTDLVKDIKASDKQSFKILFYRYYQPLYSFVWYRTHNKDICQDMLQNVFMKLWQNRSNLNPNKSIKHYLYRTACNLTIDHARTNSREVHLSPDSDVVDRKVPDQELEIKEKIYIILNSMPKDVQQVFILSRIEGMKYNEIAQLFDISVKTVEKRMGKAIKILSQHHSI